MFTLNPKLIYIHKLGDTVTFQCDANDQASQKRSVIHWRRKDGTPLPFSRTTIDGINFSIENINETDRGIYQCVASNEAATITVDSELLIENVAPRPPYNLTANSTDTTITLHWEPGSLILNDYVIQNSKMVFGLFIIIILSCRLHSFVLGIHCLVSPCRCNRLANASNVREKSTSSKNYESRTGTRV